MTKFFSLKGCLGLRLPRAGREQHSSQVTQTKQYENAYICALSGTSTLAAMGTSTQQWLADTLGCPSATLAAACLPRSRRCCSKRVLVLCSVGRGASGAASHPAAPAQLQPPEESTGGLEAAQQQMAVASAPANSSESYIIRTQEGQGASAARCAGMAGMQCVRHAGRTYLTPGPLCQAHHGKHVVHSRSGWVHSPSGWVVFLLEILGHQAAAKRDTQIRTPQTLKLESGMSRPRTAVCAADKAPNANSCAAGSVRINTCGSTAGFRVWHPAACALM